MEADLKQGSHGKKSDTTDIVSVIYLIWGKRIRLIRLVIVAFFLGLIVAFGTTKEYKSKTKLLPEISDNENGTSNLLKQFGSLSSIAGINLSGLGGSDAISPEVYPQIVHNTPFMIHLMETGQDIPSIDTTVSVYVYLTELKKTSVTEFLYKYTFGLPGKILKHFSEKNPGKFYTVDGNKPVRLSVTESKTLEKLKERVLVDVDDRSGIITITTEFPDPYLAANIAQETVDYLTTYIKDYRLQKIRQTLEFTNQQTERARMEFAAAQKKLADFRDENKNIVSARIKSEEERLQSEYNLAFNVYNGLSQQLEQVKINVQQETPVFKVLEPVQIPVEKSSPRRLFILVFSLFFGTVVGILSIFIQEWFLLNFRKKM